jgi:large subunit ribosomal protein L10
MRAEKKYIIQEVESHLKKSDYVILVNYNTVTVSDVAALRAQLDAEKAEFHVVKNSALRVAAKALELPEFEDVHYTGPTAIIVGGSNPAGVAKIVKKFFEDKQKLEIKVGVMEKKVVTAEFLKTIAGLPSLNELRAKLLSLFTANAAAFVRVLDAKVKKEGGQPAAEQPAAAPAATA